MAESGYITVLSFGEYFYFVLCKNAERMKKNEKNT
jgi:hypothetical protein